MAIKGYTTAAAIASYLGRALTAPQLAQAAALVGAVESYIDGTTRRGWLLPPVAGERYDLFGPEIYLRSAPVASVEALSTRSRRVGDVQTALTAGTDYELVDPDQGLVLLAGGLIPDFSTSDIPAWTTIGPRRGTPARYATVSYTPNLPVPADIAQAAAQLAAFWLVNQLDPARYGIARISYGHELTLAFSRMQTDGMIPEDVQATLLRNRLVIV